MTIAPANTTLPAGELVARRGVLGTLLRNPLAVASIVVLLGFVVVAAIEPWILPFKPSEVRLQLTNAPPFTTEFFLGGDRFGRDILSRLIASTRGALLAAAVVAFTAFVIGTFAGLVAGYFGGIADNVLMWVLSVLMAVPGIVILISLYSLLGTSTTVAMAVCGVLLAPQLFWMVRTLTRAIRGELYIDAARVSGLSTLRIVGRHVLVAVRAPVILLMSSVAGTGIAVQAGLEFLGLGEPALPSWGSMLTDAFGNLYNAPVQLVWPALALGLVIGSFTLISIGIRDALQASHPRSTRRGRNRRPNEPIPATSSEPGQAQNSVDVGPFGAGEAAASGVPLLVIRDLQVAYPTSLGQVGVVNGVSLHLEEGEVLGLVGESGSGKSQTVLAALGLLPEGAIVAGGSVQVRGIEVLHQSQRRLRPLRGSTIAYVPQEPIANLDPTFTVGAQMTYAIRAGMGGSRRDAIELAMAMLDRVGIREPGRVFGSYPHQISGGMAQRVLIASAVATRPRLLIADEPTTALDVTIQAEILDLLRDLQHEGNMGLLIVTHNFGVVADICDRVAVMSGGVVVEQGSVGDVLTAPANVYTRSLLDAVLDHAEPRRPMKTTEEAARV